MMIRSKVVFISMIVGFLLMTSVFFVSGFQGTSSSYSSDNKVDSFSEDNAASSSFSQRLIGGIQAVGQYVTSTFNGRFGILTSSSNNLVINITSHFNEDVIPRGDDDVNGEDDEGFVPNSFNFTAKVFDSGTFTGFSGANCFFYENNVFFGNSSTDGSGYCTMNFTKSGITPGVRNITVNYSISTSDTISISQYTINVSIIKYLTGLTKGNYRSSGCPPAVSSCYFSGDNATLEINITETNETGVFQYDPQNITANGTNAANNLHIRGYSLYPGGNISRTSEGMFLTNTTVVYGAGTGAFLRWVVTVSDNNLASLISTALHSDIGLCAGDFGDWSVWSTCVSSSQTRTRSDSSSCSEVEIQSCGDIIIGTSCFPAGTTILMADGSYKNIEDVEEGDSVISYDEVNEEQVVTKVLELESPIRDHMCKIVFEDLSELELTREHPIYTREGWKSIEPLETERENPSLKVMKLGEEDEILFSDSNYKFIESIECNNQKIQTYNLKSVERYNNFYAGDVLAHNKGECTPDSWDSFTWNSWGTCIDGEEIRTKTNNCNQILEDTRVCDCTPNWQCDEWSVCEAGSGGSVGGTNLSLSNDFVPVFEPAVVSGPMSEFNFEELSNREVVPGFFDQQITGSISGVCVLGETRCHPKNYDSVQECVLRRQFWLIGRIVAKWETTRFPRGMICTGDGEAACSPLNSCDLEGISHCVDSGSFETCNLDSNDCLKWNNQQSCVKKSVCSNGECIIGTKQDSNICEIGDRTCVGNIPAVCEVNQKEFNSWVKGDSCGRNAVCSNGECFVSQCFNNVQDSNEEGIDCGGDCVACDSVCGNSVVEEGEVCDDGNIESGDGCSQDCGVEEVIVIDSSLGDGQIEMGLGEVREVTIDKGDRISVNYFGKIGDKAIVGINKVSTVDSLQELEVHTIRVDAISDTSVTVTVFSDPVTADIPVGGSETFDFGSGGGVFDSGGSASVGVNAEGTQTRACTDLNACGVAIDPEIYPETQMCIVGLEIIYSPENLFLTLAPGTSVPFSVTIIQSGGANLEVRWYVAGSFVEGESGTNSINSEFLYKFNDDAIVKVEVLVDGIMESREWIITIDEDIDPNCNENWYCQKTACDGFFKYPINCEDLNSCGSNLEFPIRDACNCVPKYDCEDWGECNAELNVANVLKGDISVKGFENRDCVETTNCIDEEDFTIDKRECSLLVPIRIEKTEWCYEEYIDIYDVESNELVSRIKERSVNGLRRVDIGFLTTQDEGTCGFCFDNVKNYDEEGIDCGGQTCQPCVPAGSFFDYLYFSKIAWWIFLLMMTIYSAYRYRFELVNMPKDAVWEIRLSRMAIPSIHLPSFHLPRFRLPHIHLDIGRDYREEPKRVERESYLPRTRAEPKPYSGLRSKLRDWKRKGYYETAALEHSLAKTASNVRRSTHLAKERRTQERDERRHERYLARERKRAERERRRIYREREIVAKGRRQSRFFSSLFSGIKSKSEERSRDKERIRRERIRERENLRLEKVHERELENKRRERIKEEKKREKEHRKEISRRKRRAFFGGIFSKAKREEKKIIHKERKLKREGRGFFARMRLNSHRRKLERESRREERNRDKERRKREKERIREEKIRDYERRRAVKLHKRELRSREKVARKVKHESFFGSFFAKRKHKKAVKKEMRHYHRKLRKKQLSSSEASDLRRKLKEWRKAGYNVGTTHLEKKLDKHEGRDPLR